MHALYDGEEKKEQDYSKCIVHDITRGEPKDEDNMELRKKNIKIT